MRRKIKFSSTLIIIIFLISITTIAWGGSEKKARRMYNQALIFLDEVEVLKAEKLLKNIVSEHMDTSVATEAIKTLQMMESFRIIEEYFNTSAHADLRNLMTAMNLYYKEHKRYAASINELEKYGFYIYDKDTTVTIVFANNKNYIGKAFHKRGDKTYLVKGPGKIQEIEKSRNGASDDKGNKRLYIKRDPVDLKGFFVDSKKSGKLFVVKGLITNKYLDIRNFISIRSNILDSEGKVVKSKTVYAGNPISNEELPSLSVKEIGNRLRNKDGKNKMNVNILPLSTIPFMIVFSDLPEDISEFTVKAISSSSAR